MLYRCPAKRDSLSSPTWQSPTDLQQLWHLQLDSLIYSPRRLDFLTASPKENLAVAQKMALVNTKIKDPDDEPDCTQAFRLARRKENEKNTHPGDVPFQDLTAKASYSSQHCRNICFRELACR